MYVKHNNNSEEHLRLHNVLHTMLFKAILSVVAIVGAGVVAIVGAGVVVVVGAGIVAILSYFRLF